MEHDPSSPQRASAALERGLLVGLIVLIGALVVLWWVRGGGWFDETMVLIDGPEPDYAGRIDPNAASWQWLACLPGIGEAKAKAIVQYRERHAERAPVFSRPRDLAQVPGIGPAIVERITPFLVFPATADPDLDSATPTTAPQHAPTTAPDP